MNNNDIAKCLLKFQETQGIKSTLPDSIIRYRQICLNNGLSAKTTNNLVLDKFQHYLNVKSIKEAK